MDSDNPIRKPGTSRIVVGLPEGAERGLSARIETAQGDVVVLGEETLAPLVQAYMDVFTHPTMKAIELLAAAAPSHDSRPPRFHLIPGATREDQLRQLLSNPESQASARDPSDWSGRLPSASPPVSPWEHRPESSSGGLDTQAMSQLNPSPVDEHVGWRTQDDGPVFGDIPTRHSAPIGDIDTAPSPAKGSKNSDAQD